MKELSIKEKAERYDELLKKLQEAKEDNNVCDERYCCVIDDIVPELKDGEGEKIRNWLIGYFHQYKEDGVEKYANGLKVESIIAWLEKQGEQKIDNDDKAILENWEGIVKDNKEKWQLSDWFVEATLLLVQKVKHFENNENINVKGSKVMLNACINALRTAGHSHLSDWLEKQGEQEHQYKSRPRYVGEDELLEAEKQELLKQELLKKENALKNSPFVEQKPVPKFEVGDVMRTLQEAADNITSGLPVVVSIDDEYYRCNNELIAIKDQDDYEYPPMNRRQESAWSKQDDLFLLVCKNALEKYQKSDNWDANIIIDWLESKLKSLRPQNTWKPSEEQLYTLEKATHIVGSKYKSCLASLYQELKKLREE